MTPNRITAIIIFKHFQFTAAGQAKAEKNSTKPSETSSSVCEFAKILFIAEKRKTSTATQDEQEINTAWDNAYSALYKVGFILLSLNQSNQLKIQSLTAQITRLHHM